ncbi:MAG TPA: hypothetical protein VM099_02750 [Gemmatimonadaceae bacterium]|nr:hypothetical protein [Gemmatimonadaceae bacterium]
MDRADTQATSHAGEHRTREKDALAAVALIALMLGGLAIERGWFLFQWPFWLDEYHTLFLAEKGSLARSMSDLAAGGDSNPPLLFVIFRLIAQFHPLTPMTVRIASFVMVWGALVFAFLTLRRTVPRSAAFIGAFAVWCHVLTLEEAFEARFYGPWLLFAALTAWSFGIDAMHSTSRRRNFTVAASAVLLCTIHYFGIFSLTLLVAGWACVIVGRRQECRRMLPILAGPAALALCAPLFVGQRRALTVKTWIEPLNAAQVREMLTTFYGRAPFLICVFFACGAAAWYILGRPENRADPRIALVEFLPLMFLLLMPVVIIVISLLLQPSMLDRYAVSGLLGWAAVAALAAAALPLSGRIGLGLFLFYLSLTPIKAWIDRVNYLEAKITNEVAQVRPFLDSGIPIFDPIRHSLYPIVYATEKPNQFVYPDFTDSTAHQRDFSPLRILERDLARVHNARYGFPRLLRVDDPNVPSDLLVFLPKPHPPSEIAEWFPGRNFAQVGPQMYRVFLRKP